MIRIYPKAAKLIREASDESRAELFAILNRWREKYPHKGYLVFKRGFNIWVCPVGKPGFDNVVEAWDDVCELKQTNSLLPGGLSISVCG